MAKFYLPKKGNIGKKVLYKNARIIDPKTRRDFHGWLLTIGDRIADFGEGEMTVSNAMVINCSKKLLIPGLIDIQVHFRDPGQEHKEDLTSGSMSAVAGGITSVVCQPNTSPVLDNVEILESLQKKALEKAYCNIKVYPSVTIGMKGSELSDMEKMAEMDIVAGFTDDGLPVWSSYIMKRAFEISKITGKLIAQHAEDLSLSNGGCMNEGAVSRKLGVAGIPNISESVIVRRDIEILKFTGGKYHVLHVSTKESVEAIREAKKLGLNITGEASPHHFSLTDEAILEFGTNAKMNPPLRSEEDRLSLIEALQDGTIDCIATDHAPHDLEEKSKPLQNAPFGIVGVETMLSLSLELPMDLMDIISKLTYKPAKIIGFDRGYIAKNAIADLTLIDLDYEYIIDPQKFYSKSKNSPFAGRKVKGMVLKTIVGGELVYEI